jgi:hypothetical protein
MGRADVMLNMQRKGVLKKNGRNFMLRNQDTQICEWVALLMTICERTSSWLAQTLFWMVEQAVEIFGAE